MNFHLHKKAILTLPFHLDVFYQMLLSSNQGTLSLVYYLQCQVLNTLDKNKSYKLCVDGKKINPFSVSKCDGVNLFGFEEKTTSAERHERTNSEVECISKLKHFIEKWDQSGLSTLDECKDVHAEGLHSVNTLLIDVIRIISNRLMDLRQVKVKRNITLEKFKELGGEEWRTSKYMYVCDKCIQSMLYEIGTGCESTLQIVEEFGTFVACLNESLSTFTKGNVVDMGSQG